MGLRDSRSEDHPRMTARDGIAGAPASVPAAVVAGLIARARAAPRAMHRATPANNIINALKGRNAIVLAPSPKGAGTLALLLEYMHSGFDRVGAPRDLVQTLPAPVSRPLTLELMRQADLVVATGSQTNVRA